MLRVEARRTAELHEVPLLLTLTQRHGPEILLMTSLKAMNRTSSYNTLSLSFSPPALIFALPVAILVESFCFPLASFSRMFGIFVVVQVDLGEGSFFRWIWAKSLCFDYFWYWFFLSATNSLTSEFSAVSEEAKSSRFFRSEM